MLVDRVRSPSPNAAGRTHEDLKRLLPTPGPSPVSTVANRVRPASCAAVRRVLRDTTNGLVAELRVLLGPDALV